MTAIMIYGLLLCDEADLKEIGEHNSKQGTIYITCGKVVFWVHDTVPL